jgi:hypothetical protein
MLDRSGSDGRVEQIQMRGKWLEGKELPGREMIFSER